MHKKCNLKIGCLNIGGNARVKCFSDDITEIIKSHDIFIIVESWLGKNDNCPKINGFMNYRNERKRKCKARRDSGGMLIYYRQDIGKGVQKVESTLKDAIWLKLDKSYFGLNKDLYFCTVYIPPRNSPTYVVSDDGEDMHDTIAREIDIFSTLGDVAIIGDMNSRVGSIQEKTLWY